MAFVEKSFPKNAPRASCFGINRRKHASSQRRNGRDVSPKRPCIWHESKMEGQGLSPRMSGTARRAVPTARSAEILERAAKRAALSGLLWSVWHGGIGYCSPAAARQAPNRLFRRDVGKCMRGFASANTLPSKRDSAVRWLPQGWVALSALGLGACLIPKALPGSRRTLLSESSFERCSRS